ncbi:MAG: S8 family serine peptidase [Gemmatimonadota bacterium]
MHPERHPFSRPRPAIPFLLLAILFGASSCADGVEQRALVAPESSATEEVSNLRSASPGEYIVVLAPGEAPGRPAANRARALEVAAQLGAAPGHAYGTALFGFSGRIPAARLQVLERDPRVLRIEAVEDWSLDVVGAAGVAPAPTGIRRIGADRNPTVSMDGSGSSAVDVDVAIIDSGIDPDHPDLNVVGGHNLSSGPRHDWSDRNGHGTHMAGTVGAIDNGSGVVGVAPGTPLWSVRVCRANGACGTNDIVAGLDWVAEQKRTGAVDFAAANFSIGSMDTDSTCDAPANAVHHAICGVVDTGVVLVMSAGNDGRERRPFPEGISVSAIADFDGKAGGAAVPTCRNESDDTLASFSNHGERIDLAAPGVCILSTLPGGYGTLSGTSMAAPHVTGAVALHIHANGGVPASDRQGVEALRTALVSAALPQGTADQECSYDDARLGGPLLFVNSPTFGGDGECPLSDGSSEPVPTDPLIASLQIDTRTTGPWARVDVGWRVSHPAGELASVTTQLLSLEGELLDSRISTVSGPEASGEHRLRASSDGELLLRLVVASTEGGQTMEEVPLQF